MNSTNDDIKQLATTLPLDINNRLEKGLFPPQTFIYLDQLGIIQDNKNIPTIYHKASHKTDKSIPMKEWRTKPLKYSRAMAERDSQDNYRSKKIYW